MSTDASSSPAGRLLALLSLLQGRRDWPGPELARRLGVSERTVRRDVDRLRELGYPIASIGGRAGRYALHAGTAMPPLLLDDEEAIAIAVGLRTAAGSAVAGIEEAALRALAKLEQVLPRHLRRRVRTLSDSMSVLGFADGPSVDPQSLTALAAATRDRELVGLAYRSGAGERTRRTVEPHALVAHGRRWYLVAFDTTRQEWRSFRADRIERVTAGGVRFAERTIPGRSAAAFVARGLREFGSTWEAHVTYHAPAEQVRRNALRIHDPAEVVAVDERTCTRHIVDRDLDFLVMRITGGGAPFSVSGPPELLERIRVMGEWLTAAAPSP